MKVYSITYQRGRSMVERHRWFADVGEAETAMQDLAKDGARKMTGPNTHVVRGIDGMASILNAYAGDNSRY